MNKVLKAISIVGTVADVILKILKRIEKSQ